jgi:hypothetical protein
MMCCEIPDIHRSRSTNGGGRGFSAKATANRKAPVY